MAEEKILSIYFIILAERRRELLRFTRLPSNPSPVQRNSVSALEVPEYGERFNY